MKNDSVVSVKIKLFSKDEFCGQINSVLSNDSMTSTERAKQLVVGSIQYCQ